MAKVYFLNSTVLMCEWHNEFSKIQINFMYAIQNFIIYKYFSFIFMSDFHICSFKANFLTIVIYCTWRLNL